MMLRSIPYTPRYACLQRQPRRIPHIVPYAIYVAPNLLRHVQVHTEGYRKAKSPLRRS